MTLLPIVERELRVSARRWSTYLSRLSAALISILGSGWVLLGLAEEMSSPQMGQSLFVMLTTLSFLFCISSGIRNTADCISEEKREGTLGLLFLTDLKGFDIILGKLAATSLNTVYALLAVIPILAIPILLGGVGVGQFFRVILALATTLAVSLAVGILLSTYGWQGRKTSVLGTAFILILTLAPPAVGMLVAVNGTTSPKWMFPSPAFTTAAAFDAMYPSWRQQYWQGIACQLGGTVLALAWASSAITRKWQDRPATARVEKLKTRWNRWMLGMDADRHGFRTRLLDINAVYWLSSRDRIRPTLVWGYLGVIGCAWCWAAFRVGERWQDPITYYLSGIVLIVSLKVWIGSEAARCFTAERSAGSLELILSTPLRTQEILRGFQLSLIRQFLWPGIAVIGCCLLMLTALRVGFSGTLDAESMSIVLTYLIEFPLDAVALVWTGLWQGLSAKRMRRAGAMTLVMVLGLPWLISILGAVILSLGTVLFPWLRTASFASSSLILWNLLCIANSLFWILLSRHKLLNFLRQMAIPGSSVHPSLPTSEGTSSDLGRPPKLA